ncbi:LysR family transcriptional regulator [Pseudomonas sp. HK3]|jgi:DNA-binding transcriptional LysR family regulator
MLDLNQMSVFIKVVQEGSFTAAARNLNMPKSRVSRMITDLEDKLSVRLLERTTREVRPTDVGLQYYEQYKPLFEEIVDIHERISDKQKDASGHLRITAPVGFAIDIMGRWMAGFKKAYPLIDIELIFNDGDVHLIRDGFDVGFAIGKQEDSSLIARKIDDTDPVICASPAYIEQYGPFNHPDQLNDIPWVEFGSRNGYSHSSVFINNTTNERLEVKKHSSVVVNHHEIHKQHMLAGQGVGISSTFMTYKEIIDGKLVPILPQWQIEQEPLFLVFPSGKHQPKKVRSFIDFFIQASKELELLMNECENCSNAEQLLSIKKYMDNHSI